MSYQLIKRLLFCLPAEFSHNFSLCFLKLINRVGLLKQNNYSMPVRVMGIMFKNPIGLAAGLDKNGDYIDALAKLGFGFIEIGTVTPKPQRGNPKPRIFRLTRQQSIINRLGFNNKGVDYLVEQVKQVGYEGVLGINIGKNASTPTDKAVDDYLICMRKVYAYASYITINISSPNTKNLRDLQFGEQFETLLASVKKEQSKLNKQYRKYVPLALKLAPDISLAELPALCDTIIQHKIDAVIATNTTVDRNFEQLSDHDKKISGGLSGELLTDKSTQILANLHLLLGEKIPIIGVGGITDANKAQDKFKAGAKLIQLYSGLIYVGPKIIGEISNKLLKATN